MVKIADPIPNIRHEIQMLDLREIFIAQIRVNTGGDGKAQSAHILQSSRDAS